MHELLVYYHLVLQELKAKYSFCEINWNCYLLCYISFNSSQFLYFLYVVLTNVTFFFLIIIFISLTYYSCLHCFPRYHFHFCQFSKYPRTYFVIHILLHTIYS